jgi:phospholipid/cholesterol/gamma-HCH transport system ATP-binding protein
MSDLSLTIAPSQPPAESRHIAIQFDDVAISFEGKPVLDGISFQLPRGESKILLGAAGSGKSTILKLVLGLIRPDRGRIIVLGHEVTAMTEEQLFDVRRDIGMVFQESALFDSLTVRENVSYRLSEEHDISEAEIERRAAEALRFVELEHTLDMMPAELSGGMRRRVAIARAIVTQPEILLYDSPTGGLDPVTSTTILELIVKQRDVYRSSSLMVTHRLQDALLLATHRFDAKSNQMKAIEPGANVNVRTTFILLRDGQVIFDGTAYDLVHSEDPYIQEYLS